MRILWLIFWTLLLLIIMIECHTAREWFVGGILWIVLEEFILIHQSVIEIRDFLSSAKPGNSKSFLFSTYWRDQIRLKILLRLRLLIFGKDCSIKETKTINAINEQKKGITVEKRTPPQ